MRHRLRARALVAVATTIMVMSVLVACAAESPVGPPPPPLRILLVSDNGFDAPGTVALRDALRRAGHTVVQVSSNADRSHDGTAVTLGPIEAHLATADPGVWSINGSATDATLLGLAGVMGSANLVISGISSTYTASVSAMHSGTLGAALTAADRRVPAIAVGTDASSAPGARPADYTRTADFVVRLVGALQRQPTAASLLPERTVLNVNYPQGPVHGVVSAPMSSVPASTVSYQYSGTPGQFVAVNAPLPPTNSNDDLSRLAGGNVTLSDVTADPDRTAPPTRTAAHLAPRLTP